MSIESALGRIEQLNAMLAPAQPAAQTTTATSAPATSFATTLAQASAAAPATTSTALPATGALPTTALPASALSTTALSTTALPAATAAPATDASAPYDSTIDAVAGQNGVDPNLVRAVIEQESGFNPNAASGAGAQGLMQLMPGTAAGLGVTNSFDPTQSIEGGTRYLKQQLDRFGGNVSLALAAYNAGPDAVTQYGGVPPYAQTQQYVRSVLDHYQAFSSQSPTAERSSL
jgi:soluble lytic murein transglycosylase-like protein